MGSEGPVFSLREDAMIAGAQFVYEAPAVQLVKDGERVVAVIAQQADGYHKYVGTKGIVLATGDISGDDEMCERYSPLMLRCGAKEYTPLGANTGDGQKMGLWVGAKLEEAPFSPMIHPQGFARINHFFLSVNMLGHRYMNEGVWAQGKSLGVLTTEELGALIAEEDPTFIVEDFVAEVERYNEMCRNGKDTDFGKNPGLLFELVNPPFYAAKSGPSRLVCPGGILINTNGECLDANDKPIPGLYAVGNVSGGLYGVDCPLVILGNSHGRAITFGWLLGRELTGNA